MLWGPFTVISRSTGPVAFAPRCAVPPECVLTEAASSRADADRATGFDPGPGWALGSGGFASPGFPLIGGLGNRLNAIATAIGFHDQRGQLCSDRHGATS